MGTDTQDVLNHDLAARRLLIVFCVVSWLFAHGIIVGGGKAFTSGNLADTDCYARLVRVQRLLDTHDWFDISMPRFNAPQGGHLHWTRPFDVMLIAGTWLMRPWFAEREALYWAGVWISPFLHLLACMAMYWAMRPLLAARERLLTTLAFIWQLGLLEYSAAGRADHHALITLIYVVMLGFLLRCVCEPGDSRHHRGLGLTMALAMWVSVEAQIPVFMIMATLAVAWWSGTVTARPTVVSTCGWYLGVVALAIAVERPPAGWLAVENDKISVLHVGQALLFLGFWRAIACFEHLPPRHVRRATVVVVGTVAGCVLLGLVLWFANLSPIPAVDPQMAQFWAKIRENQTLWPPTPANVQTAILMIGHFFLVWPLLPILLYWRWNREEHRGEWLGIMILTLVVSLLSCWKVRLSYLAEVALAMVIGQVSGTLLNLTSERVERPLLKAFFHLAVPAVLLFGPIVVVCLVPPDPADSKRAPDFKTICADLNNTALVGSAPATILASMNHGPEIVYRTPHSIVGAPYHRDNQGLLDVAAVLEGTDDGDIFAVLQRCHAGFVLILAGDTTRTVGAVIASPPPRGLEARLSRGQIPAWLSPVTLVEAASTGYRLFRVATATTSQLEMH